MVQQQSLCVALSAGVGASANSSVSHGIVTGTGGASGVVTAEPGHGVGPGNESRQRQGQRLTSVSHGIVTGTGGASGVVTAEPGHGVGPGNGHGKGKGSG